MSQIICPISGEILQRSDLLLGFDLSKVHPIFQAKKKLILTPDVIFKFQKAQSWQEKKLYYLAVLNTTELVDFKIPADPFPYIMETTFFDVCTLATWIDYARYGIKERISFPRYLVKEDTKNLANIFSWLSAIHNIRKLYQAKDRENSEKLELSKQSAKIEQEFKWARITGQAFTKHLARWALELADTPPGVFQPWLDILQTPLSEAWCLDVADLLEIKEYFDDTLPLQHDQVIGVMFQIKELIRASRSGYVPDSPEEDFEPEEETFKRVTPREISLKPPRTKVPGFEFVKSETSSDPDEPIYEIPPEPKPKDFPKYFLYLQAKAGWDLLVQEMTGSKRSGEYKQF